MNTGGWKAAAPGRHRREPHVLRSKCGASAAQAPAFDDRAWQTVSAPHTFNDTDTFDNWSTSVHRGEQIQWSGRTWYRKTFDAPAAWSGKKVFIEFGAVRQIAEVYLNGQKLGLSMAGFTPFGFDLTPHLKFGARNVLAVMADNRFMRDPLDPATEAEIAKRNGSGTPAAPLSSTANPNLAKLHAGINETIPEKLHGWGQKATNEWPGLGAALPDWMQSYTMDLMKRAGGNFVRWGHVAGSPAQIAAGDRLGIVALQPGTDGESDTATAAWQLRAAKFSPALAAQKDRRLQARQHAPSPKTIWPDPNKFGSSSCERKRVGGGRDTEIHSLTLAATSQAVAVSKENRSTSTVVFRNQMVAVAGTQLLTQPL